MKEYSYVIAPNPADFVKKLNSAAKSGNRIVSTYIFKATVETTFYALLEREVVNVPILECTETEEVAPAEQQGEGDE